MVSITFLIYSETESNHSAESRESGKSRDTSPSHSPVVSIKTFNQYQNSSQEEEAVEEMGNSGISKRHLSKAANSHKFRKIQKPSKCRECDSYVYWQGYECADCGLASHKKCLETLHLLCGPKRLLRKMTTFGVDLGHHLLEVGAEIPPLVQRCVAVIDSRGTSVKGIYRVSGVKSKVEKLCQAFENISAEFVDLTDVHPNVIANVVKLYMRQLPEPLMTFRLYSEFIRWVHNHSDLLILDVFRIEIVKAVPYSVDPASLQYNISIPQGGKSMPCPWKRRRGSS